MNSNFSTNPLWRVSHKVSRWIRSNGLPKADRMREGCKAHHLPHHPDDPVILHRDDMINARKAFKVLRDETKRAQFDAELLQVIREAEFRVFVVVIDKATLREAYGDAAAHPYHIVLYPKK